MYFCIEKESDSGIWFYQHFRMMLRAASHTCTVESQGADNWSPLLLIAEKKIDYVNFHAHQDFAKKCVGAKAAPYNDADLLNALYPFALFKEPCENIVMAPLSVSDITRLRDRTQQKNIRS